MSFGVVLILFIGIGIAVVFLLKLSAEQQQFIKEDIEAKKNDTVLKRANIDINNLDEALEKAKGNNILLDEIKKELLTGLATANKKGNTELVRKYNSDLKKLNNYVD